VIKNLTYLPPEEARREYVAQLHALALEHGCTVFNHPDYNELQRLITQIDCLEHRAEACPCTGVTP
jgi:hypothetical protein